MAELHAGLHACAGCCLRLSSTLTATSVCQCAMSTLNLDETAGSTSTVGGEPQLEPEPLEAGRPNLVGQAGLMYQFEPMQPAGAPEAQQAGPPGYLAGQWMNRPEPPKVRMLRIFAKRNPIYFRQVEMRGVDGTNYALSSMGGKAEQNPTHRDAQRTYHAEFIIDGNLKTGNHTHPGPSGSWVTVTLAQPQRIAEVIIYNNPLIGQGGVRKALSAEGHELELVDEDGNTCSHLVLSQRSHPEFFAEETLQLRLHFDRDKYALGRCLPPPSALLGSRVSAVRIFNSHVHKPIHLRQIEIHGIDGVNYALATNGGVAEQSSLHRQGYEADNLIDGNLGSSNHTHHRDRGWVTVTLAQPQYVAQVVLFNSSSNDAPWHHAERAEGHELELIDEEGTVCSHVRLSRNFNAELFGAEPAETGTQHERKLILNFTPEALFAARVRLHVTWLLHSVVDAGLLNIDVLQCISYVLNIMLRGLANGECWARTQGRAIDNHILWRNCTVVERS